MAPRYTVHYRVSDSTAGTQLCRSGFNEHDRSESIPSSGVTAGFSSDCISGNISVFSASFEGISSAVASSSYDRENIRQ